MSGGTANPERSRREEPLSGTITSRKELRCPVCGAEFISREQRDEHERAEHHTP